MEESGELGTDISLKRKIFFSITKEIVFLEKKNITKWEQRLQAAGDKPLQVDEINMYTLYLH